MITKINDFVEMFRFALNTFLDLSPPARRLAIRIWFFGLVNCVIKTQR